MLFDTAEAGKAQADAAARFLQQVATAGRLPDVLTGRPMICAAGGGTMAAAWAGGASAPGLAGYAAFAPPFQAIADADPRASLAPPGCALAPRVRVVGGFEGGPTGQLASVQQLSGRVVGAADVVIPDPGH